MGLLLFIVFLTLFVSAVCSVLEATLLSTPLTFVQTLEDQGVKGAERLSRLKDDIDRPISAILTINTIANTAGAALVGAQTAKLFDNAYIGLASAVFTILVLVFSEIIPKTIGATYWRTLALPASKVISGMIFITYPLVIMSEWLTHLIQKDDDTPAVSREEVSAMVSVGAEEGALDNEENRMIQNLLKLDTITAHEIMTPSVVVNMANEKMTVRDFYKHDEYRKHSRIPVYADNNDYMTGYVLRQTVLERLAEDKFNTTLSELARPILSFPEDTSVSVIWEKMLAEKEHISIIIDEYGTLRGIVTMEDVIETMLGFEIVDENDSVVDMQELAKAQWMKQKKKEHK